MASTVKDSFAPGFLGLYGISEAARYLEITPPLANGYSLEPAKLRRWIRTSVRITEHVVPPARQHLITFRDLISMRLVAILRTRGVTLSEIRETEHWMRNALQIDWPFISKPMWTYESEVYTEFESHLVVASRSGQRAMDFLREWLNKVELDMTFDEYDLVTSWTPYTDIQLDPKVQIGEPCIKGTRIPVRTIWGKIQAGDTREVVARLYDLARTQIEHAVEWGDRLADVAA